MSKELEQISELESRKVAEASRETEWKQPSFLREMFLGNFRLDLIHPYPLPEEERAGVRRFLQCHQGIPARPGRFGRDRRHGRVPGARGGRPAQAGRLRHEDPEEVRRPGLHQRRVPEGDAATGLDRRQPLGAAVGPPVDRRAAAAQAVRLGRPEEEVPAALRRGRYLGLRAHRAAGRLRPGPPDDDRREDPRGRTTSSTARSSGAPTARSPSCWWSWRAIPRRRRSAPSWWRRPGRASRSSTAATSWACGRSPTP